MTGKRPMTTDEQQAAQILTGCTFPVASYNKRFARDMASIARQDEPLITERQSRTLWKLFYMYRRQMRAVADSRLFDIARPIHEAERKAERQLSLDDLQAPEEWNEAVADSEAAEVLRLPGMDE